MKTETQLTAQLVKAWREMRAEVLNLHGHMGQAPGWPDVFISHRTWTGWLEFKGSKTPWQPRQREIIKTLGRTENIWVVRFLEQESSYWRFEISDSDLVIRLDTKLFSTDGQVAAKLLQELARLEER